MMFGPFYTLIVIPNVHVANLLLKTKPRIDPSYSDDLMSDHSKNIFLLYYLFNINNNIIAAVVASDFKR